MDKALREQLGIQSTEPIVGGCIHECFKVEIAGRTLFLKCNDAGQADNFAAEADGLAALRGIGLRAPEPLSHGTAGGKAFLLLEFLDLGGRRDFAALGRMLAQAHRRPGPRFGWSRGNYIGATPQANGWRDDWAAFWRERRLNPQLELAKRNGFDLRFDDDLLETILRSPRCCTAICGAAMRGLRPKGRWCSTRRRTTATAKPISR